MCLHYLYVICVYFPTITIEVWANMNMSVIAHVSVELLRWAQSYKG